MRKLFLFLLFSQAAFCDPIVPRRNWILEQLSTPVGQTSIQGTQSRFRCALNVTNYSDAFSGMLSALADLGPLEIAAYASQRFYGNFTEAGRDYREASAQDSDSLAGELARAYMTREGHFGRASAQYIFFSKNRTSFLRLGVNMGIFEMGDSPWILRLNTHLYFPVQGGENKAYSTGVEVGQTIGKVTQARWRLGFLFSWTYKTRGEFTPPLGEAPRNEHMLFSIGPWLEYATVFYNLKLGVPWRFWLDKETYTQLNDKGNEATVVHYPSEVKIPDIQLNLSFFL